MSVFQQFFGSATAIVNQTNAGSNSLVSQIASGGGGGGGAGPNPVVSTLTFSEGNQSNNTNGTINMSTFLNILDPAVPTPVNNHFQFATNQNSANYPAYISQYQSTLTNFSMWGPSSNTSNTGSFGITTDILGRSQISAAHASGALSTLVISADSVLVPTGMNISSLTVSSINGAAPGSGSALSTFNQLFTSSIGVPLSANNELTFIGPNGNNNIVFSQPNVLQSQIQFLTSTIVNGAPTVGAFIGADDLGGISQNLTIGTGNPGVNVNTIISSFTLSLQAPTAVSSLTVSSINGAAPGGGSAISTFNQLFTSTIQCLNPVSQNLIITGNNNNLVVDLETPLISRLRFAPSTSIGNGGGQGPFIKVEDQGNANYTLSIQSDAAPALTTSISSLTVSSINGGVPALTSLFSTLFAANPTLSTILY